MNENVAVFWDLENVNLKTDEIDKFLEFLQTQIKENDTIVYSVVYFTWLNKSRAFAEKLAMHNFKLLYIPKNSNKNNLDMQLASDLSETLYFFPNISKYILIAGDSDYIPVIKLIQKFGKKVTIIHKAMYSENLIKLVGQKNCFNYKDCLNTNKEETVKINVELEEAVKLSEKLLEKEKKINSLEFGQKLKKLKINYKVLGFKKCEEFVNELEKIGIAKITETDAANLYFVEYIKKES